jgi:threonine dehydrogenase-like Zn-dependent dehydrogenase
VRAWEVRAGLLGLYDVEPVEPWEGQTVVRVTHVGVCGSDRPKLLRPGRYPLPSPWRPGHEVVGLHPDGRAVAVDPLVPCGACPRCAVGDTHLCPGLQRIGWDLPGGFAEELVVPTGNVYPVPPGIAALHASLADPAAVAVHGLRCTAIRPPGRLAVIGAGAIGLLTALRAHVEGWNVTVVHRDARGVDDALAKAVPAVFRSPAAMRPQDSFDVVVDAASGADPAPLDLALRLVHDGGTVVVQNAYEPGVRLGTPLRDLLRRSIRLVGSFSYCRRPPGDFALALDLLRDHSAQVAQMVTETQFADLPAVLRYRSHRQVRDVLAVIT